MVGYVRSSCVAGIAVMAASAVAFTPSIVPTPPDIAVPAVNLTATQAPSPELIKWLQELQESASHVAVSPGSAPTVIADAVIPAALPVAGPAPLNAASDAVVTAYQAIQYWVDYGVELAQYGTGFIPFIGGLISAQIGFFYWDLIRPIADSVVYNLISPVLNDPLNLAVWWNGIVAVAMDSVNALINFGWNELNYFIPLPPLPGAAITATSGRFGGLPQISSIPSLVKSTLGAAGIVDVSTTGLTADANAVYTVVNGVHNVAKSAFAATAATAQDAVATADTIPAAVAQVTADIGATAQEATARVNTAIEDHVEHAAAIATTRTIKGAVSAQGEVRSSAVTAATDLGGGAQPRTPGGVVKDAVKAQGTVAGGLSDTVKDAVKGAQQAGKNIGATVNAAHSSDDQ